MALASDPAGERARRDLLGELARLDLAEQGSELLPLAIGEVGWPPLGRADDLDHSLALFRGEAIGDVIADRDHDLGGGQQPGATGEPPTARGRGVWVGEGFAERRHGPSLCSTAHRLNFQIYAVPVEHVPATDGWMRIDPTQNGQQERIRWARDYELPG
jgi:hypothetical protein